MTNANPVEQKQTQAVFKIVQYLYLKKALSPNPQDIELTRKGYDSVFPCGRDKDQPKMDQLLWASNNNKWWFNGPVIELKISKLKGKLIDNEIKFLRGLANDADIKLSLN